MQYHDWTTREHSATSHPRSGSKMLFNLQNVVKATPSADEKLGLGERLFFFFLRGERKLSSRPASPLIIVSKESGKNP